jgi:hypothetical protein
MLAFALLACATTEPAPATPPAEAPEHERRGGGGGGGGKAKGRKGGRDGGGKATDTGTLKSLTNGDVACYVELDEGGGQVRTYHGSFELCPGNPHDASALIGQRVELSLRKEEVLADSCQGDPACADRQEVDLVVSVEAVSGG